MSEQQKNLNRVSSRIAAAILEFCTEGREFHADELRRHVDGCVATGVAPGSADRILRDLRKRRKLNYKVLNRKNSLYRVIPAELEQSALDLK